MEQGSIKGIIQSLQKDGLELMQGKVIEVNPLKIQVINDEKLILNERNTIIPWHLSDYKTIVDINAGSAENGSISSQTSEDGSHYHEYEGVTEDGGEPAHGHKYGGITEEAKHTHALNTFSIFKAEITVYNALKIGEIIHIMALNKGKLYYILDRVVTE